MGAEHRTAVLAAPEITSPAPRQAWARVLATNPDATVGQSLTWRDAVLADGAFADASVHYAFGGPGPGREVVMPLVRRRLLPGVVASWPQRWGQGGPVSSDGRIDAAEARFVLADVARRAAVAAVLTLGPEADPAWLAAAHGWEAEHRSAYLLDLSGGFERVWTQRFRGTARTAMRKAEKAGLEIESDRTGRLAGVYDLLHERSVRRRAAIEGEPVWLARWRMSRVASTPAQVALVARTFGTDCTTWVARRDGEPVAAIIVLEAGTHAKYWRGAMDKELGGRVRANDLLHRLAIEDACARGRLVYDMGAAVPGTPLGDFKAKLGAAPVPTHELRARRRPARWADAARLRAEALVKRAAGLRDL